MGSSEEGNSVVGAGSWSDMVEEMMSARHSAAQLQGLLREIMMPPGSNYSSARAILEDLDGSIARVLSLMEGDQEAVIACLPSCGDVRGEVSSRKRKKIAQSNTPDLRVASRRRSQPSSCRTVVSKKFEDGRTWRKYGQKHIHSSKHPRSYFRCTHKYDQGCKALKQVQCSEEDPTKLMVTYIDEHTCVDPSTFPHIISNSGFKDSCLISFGQESPLLNFASSISQKKKELDDEELLSVSSSSAEMPQAIAPINTAAAATSMVSDHGDASSQSPVRINLEFEYFMTDRSLGFYDQNVVALDMDYYGFLCPHDTSQWYY